MLNKVILPYTIWYTGLKQILRLNLDKDIETVSKLVTEVSLNGGEVNDVVYAVFNQPTKSIDITIRSDARMDVDGEMKISLSYSDTKTHEITLVVMVRSHENTIEEISKEVKQTKLTLLNSQSHTVGAEEEPVVYSFDLVNRDVTNEFATYGDVKDMLTSIGITDSGQKDQYTLSLEGDNLVLLKENDPSYRREINLAKYHDEVSGSPLNVEDLKRDILSIVDGKLPNVETLKSDILSEAATKDAQLKVDILHEVDGKIPNANTIKQEILADVNPRIPDKETLKTEILESAGEKDTALKTAILEEVGTRTTANNQSLKQEIMGEVDGKLPNTAVLKENILGEVDTKITTNNQTFKSTVMSEVDSKIPDVSVVKSEILNEINPKLLDKETLKQEILSTIPTPANYTLTMEDDNLVLSKEGDASYRKVINLSKYHDEVTGQTVDVEQIKQNILAEVNPKLIDKDSFKNEVLGSIPSQTPVSPSKLVSNPSVTNGVLKFNTETDAPTVDFTNDFYTKAKVDELLGSSSGSNTPGNNKLISGSGRPDANDHPNNNAPVGTIFVDVNSTNGASVWYKDKTNTWKVIVGDTGWIDLKNINVYNKSKIQIRRINDVVYLKFGGLQYGLFGHIPYGKMTAKKEKNKIFRIVDISGIPIGFRSDDAYIGSIISDIDEPGSIVASYYVGGQSDSNFIKVLYNNIVPEKDVKDLRPQPGSWPIGTNQLWPKI